MGRKNKNTGGITLCLYVLIGLLGVVNLAWAMPFAYVANQSSNDVSAYTITAGTGVLVPVAGSPFAAGASPSSVTVSPAAAAIPTLSTIGYILLVLTMMTMVALQLRGSSC